MSTFKFVKLTLKGGFERWVNANFISTVDKRIGDKGSLVFMADGQDMFYVEESPAAVIEKIER